MQAWRSAAVETMRKHYLALDETEIADDVLKAIQDEPVSGARKP